MDHETASWPAAPAGFQDDFPESELGLDLDLEVELLDWLPCMKPVLLASVVHPESHPFATGDMARTYLQLLFGGAHEDELVSLFLAELKDRDTTRTSFPFHQNSVLCVVCCVPLCGMYTSISPHVVHPTWSLFCHDMPTHTTQV